jgi:hypothetical protein
MCAVLSLAGLPLLRRAGMKAKCHASVIASAAKQSNSAYKSWIASSLRFSQ